MCARPTSSSRALLRVCTREPTHRKRPAVGMLTILWAIDRSKRKWMPPIICRNVLNQISKQAFFISDYPAQRTGAISFSIGLLGATFTRLMLKCLTLLPQHIANCLTFLDLKKSNQNLLE